MSDSVNGNGSAESYSAAVRDAGGVWNGGGCQLEEGVSAIRQQLEQMKAAKERQAQLAIEQLTRNVEQQNAASCVDGAKAALTEALKAGDAEGAADAITCLVDAVARFYRVAR